MSDTVANVMAFYDLSDEEWDRLSPRVARALVEASQALPLLKDVLATADAAAPATGLGDFGQPGRDEARALLLRVAAP